MPVQIIRHLAIFLNTIQYMDTLKVRLKPMTKVLSSTDSRFTLQVTNLENGNGKTWVLILSWRQQENSGTEKAAKNTLIVEQQRYLSVLRGKIPILQLSSGSTTTS